MLTDAGHEELSVGAKRIDGVAGGRAVQPVPHLRGRVGRELGAHWHSNDRAVHAAEHWHRHTTAAALRILVCVIACVAASVTVPPVRVAHCGC